jgi:ribosomal protein S18 acetylase RimI-like enzyme
MSDYHIDKLSREEALGLADDIVRVYRDSWIATYTSGKLGITDQDLRDHFEDFDGVVGQWQRDILGADGRAVWVARDGSRVVGFCVAKKSTSLNELEYIYIFPEVQGKGVGSALMREGLAWMDDEKPIELYGAAYNENAINFYRHYGFKLTDEAIPSKRLRNGKELPSMRMVRVQPER